MPDHRASRFILLLCAVLLLASVGCVQPISSSDPNVLSVDQGGPTFTPPPSLEPQTEFLVVTATPDPFSAFGQGGAIAPTADPFLPTLDPLLAGVSVAQQLDPVDAQSTAIVLGATETAGVELTQTFIAIFGGPTATQAAPISFATATPGAAGPILSGTDCIHTVSVGENVFRIGIRYGVSVQQIANATPLTNPNVIRVGDQLVIPGCGTTGSQPPPTTVPNPGTGTGVGSTYVVQQGDTLFKISQRFGVPVLSIANANAIQNINLIVINQELVIPAS